MKQRVFRDHGFSAADILQCRFDGIDRIVLRGAAVAAFHEGLGTLWRKNGNEVIPPDIEEIQGTAESMEMQANDLGQAMSYRWDYIERLPIDERNGRSNLFENGSILVQAERGECYVENVFSKYRARLDGSPDGYFTLNMLA